MNPPSFLFTIYSALPSGIVTLQLRRTRERAPSYDIGKTGTGLPSLKVSILKALLSGSRVRQNQGKSNPGRQFHDCE